MVSDIVTIHHQVSYQLVFEFKARMIATDMNAHAQFKHAREIESENPATLSRNGVFYPRSYYMSNLNGRTYLVELFMLLQQLKQQEQELLVLLPLVRVHGRPCHLFHPCDPLDHQGELHLLLLLREQLNLTSELLPVQQ